jgi:hypothetical protein
MTTTLKGPVPLIQSGLVSEEDGSLASIHRLDPIEPWIGEIDALSSASVPWTRTRGERVSGIPDARRGSDPASAAGR